MTRRYIIFVSLLTLLLVVSAVASPQSNTTAGKSDIKGAPEKNTGSESAQPVLSPGHLVKRAVKPNSIDLYGRAKNIGYPGVKPVYQLAQSSGPSAAETTRDSADDSKADTAVKTDPVPTPTVADEIEALKARIADLETKLGENGGSAPPAGAA